MLKNNTSLLIVYHYDIYFNSEGDVCIYRGIKEIFPYIFRNNFFNFVLLEKELALPRKLASEGRQHNGEETMHYNNTSLPREIDHPFPCLLTPAN